MPEIAESKDRSSSLEKKVVKKKRKRNLRFQTGTNSIDFGGINNDLIPLKNKTILQIFDGKDTQEYKKTRN